MSFNLPNPSLLGILLVISTHSGPQLAFKYPEDLSSDAKIRGTVDTAGGASSSSDEDDDEEEDYDTGDDDEKYSHLNNSRKDTADVLTSDDNFGSNPWDTHRLGFYMGTKKDLILFLDDQERNRKHKSSLSSRSTKKLAHTNNFLERPIFGIEPAYLCEMLAPPKKMCNSRFEITIDDKIFLGLPIQKYDNGSWRLKESKKKDIDDEVVIGKVEVPSTDTSEPEPVSTLNMFHLVFIMNPPVIEINYRIDEMFHYVISRLSLVLRYEQLKADFMSKQLRIMYNLKEQYKETDLLHHLINNSPLCKIIFDCYSSISRSQIANLSINNKLRSFQIPIKTEFHSLPEPTVPYLPGSHLSSTVNLLGNSGLINVGETTRYGQNTNILTSNYLQNIDLEEGTNAADDVIYFALLLLDDPESIIRDIKTEQDSTLANFINMIKPTESLMKLSLRNTSLDLSQIRSFAFHLIYWRRARVIQPLSTRSAYIISPMAPISINLFNDIKKFRNTYPSLPSLPHFLKLISSPSRKPQQFATIIPSKDHRDVYLEALSWLIRYGYVTQLQTFIWMKISRKIKIKVEEDMENESLSRKRSGVSKSISVGTDNTSKDTNIKPADNTISMNDEREIENIKERLKANSLGPKVSLEDDDDTIILDPGRATTLERKWIKKIISDECKLSNELIAIFYKLLKYMNGKSPLELLLLKENISRTELRKLLLAIEDHIISVRHW